MPSAPPPQSTLPETWRRWWPRLAFIAFIVLLLYVVFGKEGGIIRVMELKQENDKLKNELRELQAESEELRQQIESLKLKDPKLIEEEARRKGMVREGETVYRIRYRETPDSTEPGDDIRRPGGR